MSTEHVWVQEHIDTYLTRGLSGEERARFESHAAACGDCASALNEAKETDRELKDLFADARPKPGLEDRIIRQIRRAPARKINFPPRAWKIGAGIAAAGLIGLLGYVSTQTLERDVARRSGATQELFDQSAITSDIPNTQRTLGPVSSDEMASSYGDTMLARADNNEADARRYKQQSNIEMQPPWGTVGDDIPTGTDGKLKSAESLDHEEFQAGKRESKDFVTDKASEGYGYYGPTGGGSGGSGGGGRIQQGQERSGSIASGGWKEGEPANKPDTNSPTSTSSVYRDERIEAAKPADAEYFRPGTEAESKLKGGELARSKDDLRKSLEDTDKKRSRNDISNKEEKPQQAAQGEERPTVQRKVIRNGEMEFEVEGFDSAYMQITKIVTEEGGFIASTNSDKLPNGKVKGTVTIRVAPDRLDTLVLKLRALGDLKSQQLRSQDITKQYTDLESALRAARAMEERLIKIIKDGRGEMKDILAAEQQLGVYREKIEHLEGEIRYYNNLVSLSTLSITLYEKDIKTPYAAKEIETVRMGIEAEDVKKAYDEALKEIADKKGRVTKSELKKYDADQFQAVIVCEIAPEASGLLRDRLSQLGKVSRLDIDRSQTTEGGTGRPEGIRVERKDSRFEISMYNIANISPRETVHLNLACADVEEVYNAILARIRKSEGGRIVTSNLNRQKPEETMGSVKFEIRSGDAEAVLADVRAMGESLQFLVTENPDTNNVTKSKRGFNIALINMALVAPRETVNMTLASGDVEEAYKSILARIEKAGGRVIHSGINRGKAGQTNASLGFEIKSAEVDAVDQDVRKTGEVLTRTVTENSGSGTITRAKRGFYIQISELSQIKPREATTMRLAARSVPDAYRTLLALIQESKGRVLYSMLNENDRENITGELTFDLPREKVAELEKILGGLGDVYARALHRAGENEVTVDSKVGFAMTLVNVAGLPARETTQIAIEVANVDRSFGQIKSKAMNAGGRIVDEKFIRRANGAVVGYVVIDLPLANGNTMLTEIEDMADVVRVRDTVKNPQVPDGPLAKARLQVTVSTIPQLGGEKGVGSTVRDGLDKSIKGLLWSLQYVVIGLCFVVPWGLIAWPVWRMIKRRRKQEASATEPPAEPPAV